MSRTIHGIKGLYAITPDEPDTAILLSKVRQALLGGVRVLQYRNKQAGSVLRAEQAGVLCKLAHEFDAIFIVNDDCILAKEVGTDGVHLGGDDLSIEQAREVLGEGQIIGASCYNQLSLALDAVRQSADYVAFGAFFRSGVKPDAVEASPQLLQQASQVLNVPIVAIGGITSQNGSELIAAGADALAVISAVFAAPDIQRAAQEFTNLFDKVQ